MTQEQFDKCKNVEKLCGMYNCKELAEDMYIENSDAICEDFKQKDVK